MERDVNFSNESGPTTSQTTTTTTTTTTSKTTTLLSRATRVALELAADLSPISKQLNNDDDYTRNSSTLILDAGELLARNYTGSGGSSQDEAGQELQVGTTTSSSSMLSALSSVNMSATSLSKILGQLSSWEVVLVGLLIALILISIVGNCLVCVAIFTDRRLRKLGNAFIVSLAIADLFVSCLVMTFALANDLMDYWMFGARFCDIWISFDIMCCTASILNLCAISLDRFIHIKDCLLYNQLMTRRVAISAVIGIWIISALVSFVPINLGWHKPSHFKAMNYNTSQQQQQQQQQHLLQRRLADQMGPIEWPIEAAHAHAHTQDHHQSETRIVPFQSVKFAQEPRVGHNTRVASLHNSSAAAAAATVHLKRQNDHNDAQAQVDFRKLAGQTSGWQRRRRRRRRSTGQNYSPDDQVQSNPSGELQQQQQQQQIKQTKRGAKKARRHSSDQTMGGPLSEHGSIDDNGPAHLPQCMLTLTPTYAIISSTISFYIPCLIMLGLYSRLFACARRHVRNIRAITRAPDPIGGGQQVASNCPQSDHDNQHLSSSTSSSSAAAATAAKRQEPSKLAARARTWIKFRSLGKAPLACELTGASSRPLAADQRTGSGGAGGGKVFETIDKMASTQQTETEPFLCPTGSGADLSAGQSTRQQKVALNLSATTLKLSSSSSGPPASQNQNQHQQQQQQQSLAAQVQQQQQQQQQHKQQTSQLATHKAAITLGIIMGTFLFCWVPFFCLNIIKAFCVDSIPSSMFRAFTWLGYANSALNPIIYGIHNSEFRNAFNRIFFKHLTLKNGRQYLNRRFSYDLRNHHHHHHQQAHNQRSHNQHYNSTTPQRNVNVLTATAATTATPNVHITTTTTTSTTNENANNGNHHRNHLAAARQDHNNNNNNNNTLSKCSSSNDYLSTPTKAELSSGTTTNVVPTAAAAATTSTPAVVESAAPTNLRSCPTVS